MKTWKKNLVAAGVLVTVCAGIYLNWLYTEPVETANLDDVLDSDKLLDSSMVVMANGATQEQNTNLSDTATDYFAAVRLSRQEARDSAVNLLQEAMAYDNSGDSDSEQELEQIIQVALHEAQIESLVIAKGYADCVAYMSDNGISVAVAVPENGLNQEDVARITDIILQQTDYTMEDIRIVEVQ